MKPGGTEGGGILYMIGISLIALGTYLFFDSVRVNTGGAGWISSGVAGGRGGLYQTTSMGIIFVPLLIGIGALTYDSSKRWPWVLSGIGVLIIAIEILSRVRFVMDTKTTHLLFMLGMIAVGFGLLAKAVYQQRSVKKSEDQSSETKQKSDSDS